MGQSVFYSCMESIRAKIISLALADILPANVVILKILRDLEKDLPVSPQYPCILIGPIGTETLDPNGGPNDRDDVVYPINVVMLDIDNQNQTANFDRNLLWRERIRNKLNNRRLDEVPSVIRVTVKPGTIIHQDLWLKEDKWASALLVNVTSRETRIP